MPRRGLASAILLLAATAGRAEQPAVSVHADEHMGYGRIIIDAGEGALYRYQHDGDHVKVIFNRNVTLGDAPEPPTNVKTLKTGGQVVELSVAEGARVHTSRLNGKVIIDIMNPVAPAPPRPASTATDARPRKVDAAAPVKQDKPTANPDASRPNRLAAPAAPTAIAATEAMKAAAPSVPASTPSLPAPASPATALPSAVVPTPVTLPQAPPPAPDTPVRTTSLPPPAVPDVSTTPEMAFAEPLPPGRDVAPGVSEGPTTLRARRVPLPRGIAGTAFLVPFAPTTAAALFRDHDGYTAVFDERRPVDLFALRQDPTLAPASAQLLAQGTLIHVPLPTGQYLSLTQLPGGWRIAALPAMPRLSPLPIQIKNGTIDIGAEEPGNVVMMADPRTGATLLIGTQHRSGSGVLVPRRTMEFALRPTLQGVVLEALSDRLALKRTSNGFQVSGGPQGLFISPPRDMPEAAVSAALLSRRFAFGAMRPDALYPHLKHQIADAAAAPPLARGPLNHRAAETMLALGMGAEAQSLLRLAAEQDPREAASADNAALAAIAALMAGRVGESEALADRRLDGTDEIALWRAVRQAMLDEGSPSAAAVFATTAPLAAVYPEGLRDHILPLILETMLQGGEIAPAKRLLEQRPDDAKLAYARALLRQAEGDTDGSLAMYDALAAGRDSFNRNRAAVQAVELRLASHAIDAAQAADALDKLLYSWRGDRREAALRIRVAELRAQSGRWGEALGLLRQTATDFPDQSPAVHRRLLDTFAAMIHDTNGQKLQPLRFVSLVDENADLVGDSAIEGSVNDTLADDLLALDLPQQAKPVLEKLLAHAATDPARDYYGLSLATLLAREGDPAGALSVLDTYKGESLPDGLKEDRLLLQASARAKRGEKDAAVALLAPLHSARATELRARILQEAGDWPAAEQAWADCAAMTIPADGALDPAQSQIVLQFATAAARAHDNATLNSLKAKYGARIGAGPLANMFRLLTADPVNTTADIARSGKEASLVATLPNSLAALKGNTLPR